MQIRRTGILVILVIAQFGCVSLWFAGNSVMDDLIRSFHLPVQILGHLTSAAQLGFIGGTLLYAIFSMADRISPSAVFFASAIFASIANLGIIFSDGIMPILYGSRFMTGFFLAGIYPVGMKIAADYFDKELGKALGYLLGALVLGTAFPHLLRSVLYKFQWDNVLVATSLMSLAGGALVYFMVPDGPFRRKGVGFDLGVIFSVFRDKNFRGAAFGYFGHMWELYAFWTFVPVILAGLVFQNRPPDSQISTMAFSIIGIGSLACILGGYASQKIGSYKVAYTALVFSGASCFISPLIFSLSPSIIYFFLLFWGMAVIMDSPQFSTLIAHAAPPENKASALTIINCIGFSITIVSIQLLNLLSGYISLSWIFIFLLPGPLLGLIALSRMNVSK